MRVETPVFHDREVEVVKYLPGEIEIREVERLVREVVIREVPVEVIVTMAQYRDIRYSASRLVGSTAPWNLPRHHVSMQVCKYASVGPM